MLIQRESITEIEAAAARVERTLLMIPGPTAITAEVLAAGARPVLSHSDPRMRSFVAESLARLRRLFDAPSSQPIIAAGSGTLAMEIGLANLIEPGDRVLVLESWGLWWPPDNRRAQRCRGPGRVGAAGPRHRRGSGQAGHREFPSEGRHHYAC